MKKGFWSLDLTLQGLEPRPLHLEFSKNWAQPMSYLGELRLLPNSFFCLAKERLLFQTFSMAYVLEKYSNLGAILGKPKKMLTVLALGLFTLIDCRQLQWQSASYLVSFHLHWYFFFTKVALIVAQSRDRQNRLSGIKLTSLSLGLKRIALAAKKTKGNIWKKWPQTDSFHNSLKLSW